MINFLTRPEKVEELIELISNDKEVKDIVTTIHLEDNFSFLYKGGAKDTLTISFRSPCN